jgi:hypothetical protein
MAPDQKAERGTNSLALEPLDDGDISFAYQLAAELEVDWLRVYGHGPLAPHTFGDSLWRDVLAIYVVRRLGVPIGVTSLYEVDFRHGVGWVELVLAPGLPGSVEVRDAIAGHMVEIAHAQFGLHKLFCAHAGCDAPPLGSVGREEARLEDCIRHDGWYWDRVITSVVTESAVGLGAAPP